MTAPELSPMERVVVARFGLDEVFAHDFDCTHDPCLCGGLPLAKITERWEKAARWKGVSPLLWQAAEYVPALVAEVRGHRDRAARIRALEREARDEYAALKVADPPASVPDLVGAEARVVALAAAADIAEGVVI